MEADFLRRAHDVLADMRRHIVDATHAELAENRDEIGDGPGDVLDVASVERAREVEAVLSHRDRDKLVAIERALARLEAGVYGVCDACEEDIAEERLALLPFTQLCVTCQAAREREEAQHRRPAGPTRSGVDLSALDTDED